MNPNRGETRASLASMRQALLRTGLALLAACAGPGTATAVPVNISYAAIVTSNSGEATDGIFPPGTAVTVRVQVDSESLLSGDFLPASGAAEAAGVANMTLPVDRAGSGEIRAVPGAVARVYTFSGEGPAFEADGDPPSGDIWHWNSASLFLPFPLADLDSLLDLTLDDVNDLVAAFGSMNLLTFTHEFAPGGFEFARAATSALYDFSIGLAPMPEPTLPILLALAAAAVATVRRRARRLLTAMTMCVAAAGAQAAYEGPNVAPRLFFTDLTSGPGCGGQDDLGVFVTIWGEGFGATRGGSRVTIGGVVAHDTGRPGHFIAGAVQPVTVHIGFGRRLPAGVITPCSSVTRMAIRSRATSKSEIGPRPWPGCIRSPAPPPATASVTRGSD